MSEWADAVAKSLASNAAATDAVVRALESMSRVIEGQAHDITTLYILVTLLVAWCGWLTIRKRQ